MGSAQSTPSSASARARTDGKYSGLFELTKAQTQVLKIISDIFQQILSEKDNNIFSLQRVLGNPEQCNQLILVLSNSLEKEFRTLRFPDPLVPDNTLAVSFMLKNDYDELIQEPNRKSLCSTLIFFMIRLITLIAAITASLQMNTNIVNLLDLVKYQSSTGYNKKIKSPQYSELQKQMVYARQPIDSMFLERLKIGGLVPLKLDDKTTLDKRNLWYFKTDENLPNLLVLDIDHSVAFFGKLENTSVSSIYGIKLDEVSISSLQQIRDIERRPEVYRNFPPRYGGRDTRRNNRKSRKSRKETRKATRKQRGGSEKIFVVTLTNLFCKSSSCVYDPFYMEADGKTYSKREYEAVQQKLAGFAQSKSLLERMVDIEASSPYDTRIIMMEIKDSDSQLEKFRTVFKIEKETLNQFKIIEETIREKKEGTSPCFYRAFLLASRLDGDTLQTLVCQDEWKGKVTGQISYSLLQSLYHDRQDGTMNSTTQKELTQTLDQFVNVFDTTEMSGFSPTFEGFTFRPNPKELEETVCQTQDSGSRPIREEQKKRLLMEAHKLLHEKYEQHIKSCTDLLLQIMTLETTEGYLAKPKIHLSPTFLKEPGGSFFVLEKFIQAGRTMLATHYLEVETIYQDTLSKMTALARGNIAQAKVVEPGTNLITMASNKLP